MEEKDAVALRLHKDKAPEILAVGKGADAEAILKIAEENSVPVRGSAASDERTKLALHTEIPRQYYDLVAEILWFVHRLEEKWKENHHQKKSTDRRMQSC